MFRVRTIPKKQLNAQYYWVLLIRIPNANIDIGFLPRFLLELGMLELEGNRQADSIVKDASTLPHSAAPVDFSTAKTVIRHHLLANGVEWPSQQYPMPNV